MKYLSKQRLTCIESCGQITHKHLKENSIPNLIKTALNFIKNTQYFMHLPEEENTLRRGEEAEFNNNKNKDKEYKKKIIISKWN